MDVVDILKEMILDFQQQRPTAGVARQLAYKTMREKAFVCIGVMREQGLKCGVIVTRDESETLTVEEGHVSVVPIWQFLLF